MPSPRNSISKFPQDSLKHTIPPDLGGYHCLLEGLLHALEVVTPIKKPDVFMRIWDIFETSVPVLTKEQDNQNKENLKGQQDSVR